MTRKNYSKNESLRRLVRTLRGEVLSDDQVSLYENEEAWEQSLSDIVELLQNSYPGYTATIPDTVLILSGSYSSSHDDLHNSSYIYELLSLNIYDAEPARTSVSDIFGGFNALATAQPLDSGNPIAVNKGIGKIVFVLNAGSDVSGTITVSGTTVDRVTGDTTLSNTNTITVDALTTDLTANDANSNPVYSISGAYITSHWFQGSVGIFTSDLTLTDVDVYHVSFEQFNDQPDIILDTFDSSIKVTNAAAEFDAYLYVLDVLGGGKINITSVADLHVGAVGFTAIANTYNRLRRGNLNRNLNGTTDGIWAEIHYSNSPAYVEDVNLRVWARIKRSLNI